ncbi:ABC transporter permease [bacterium]|nr:ABC transporter permease [bacterium]
MIWKLIKKDIRRRIKQPAGYLMLIAMPVFFALLMGIIFGPKDSDDTLILVKTLIEDHDDSFASHFIINAFGSERMGNMFEVTPVDSGAGRPMMEDGKASALLIIPAGFGDSLLHQNPVALTLVKNPGEAFAPKIAEETILVMAEAGDRLIALTEGPLKTIRNRVDSKTDLTEAEMALMAIQTYRLIKKADRILFPPLIKLASSKENKESTSDRATVFAYILCGVLVMSLLFSLEILNRDFFFEQENHTLTRQLLATGIFRFVTAKLLFIYLSGMISFAVVWMIAIPLFGIGVTPVLLLRLAVFALVLMAGLTGVISLIYALARNRNQGQSIAPAVILGFSMLGGAMVPLGSMPGFIRSLAVISPVYWGINAMQRLVVEQAPIGDILQHILVLGLLAILFLVPSVFLQKRKLSQ